MKGQMFIIIGIIVSIFIIFLKTTIGITSILENKQHLEAILRSLTFQNLKNELTKTIQISYNKTDVFSNVNDFLNFSRRIIQVKDLELDTIAVEAIFPNVSAGIDTQMNVTIYNLLNTKLQNLDLSFSYDNSVRNFTNIADNSIVDINFTFNTNSNVNYTLSVFYKSFSSNSTESISIPVEIGKSKLITFFDLKLAGSFGIEREKFTETITLP